MKRLSDKQCNDMLSTLLEASQNGQWDNVYNKYNTPAHLEFPIGEMLNEKIRGFIFAWKLQNCLTIMPIERIDRFNAQGLEGKIRVMTSLITALLVYRELPKYRCQIFR